MREFLSRGKRIDNGEWIFGSLIHRGDYCCILPPDGVLHDSEEPYMDSDLGTFDGKAIPVDPETVGQYTCLTDKNGKRIFEGDVVVIETDCIPSFMLNRYVVVWDDDQVAYKLLKDNTIYDLPMGRMETIGNIHDNPELLEGKE